MIRTFIMNIKSCLLLFFHSYWWSVLFYWNNWGCKWLCSSYCNE